MTTAAKIAFGAQLWMGPAAGTLVQLTELLSVTPPTLSRETIDATTHESAGGAKEYIAQGIYDAGEVSAQFHYIAASTADTALMTALTDGVKRDFKIVAKAGSGNEELKFSGFVTSYGVDELAIDGKQTCSLTVKLTGAMTEAAGV